MNTRLRHSLPHASGAFLLLSSFLFGCAGAPSGTTSPPLIQTNQQNLTAQAPAEATGENWLWSMGTLYINDDHSAVEAVPRRADGFHLNALKFLEQYCADCLKITGISDNGDGTINLTVQIKHPFPDNPEYTGFDVKLIIMFDGSYELRCDTFSEFPYGPWWDGDDYHISWANVGDPEVLNPDGYTPRWCPTWYSLWDPQPDLPIFKYWEGKYSNGTPTANVNAFKNFYTDEVRHMFRVNGTVSQTYHISLPPGRVIAGYAVDAHWHPPSVTPVTDPLNDFPVTANEPEPYFFEFVINNEQPITDPDWYCYTGENNCQEMRLDFKIWWYDGNAYGSAWSIPPWSDGTEWMMLNDTVFSECVEPHPPDEIWFANGFGSGPIPKDFVDGTRRGVAILSWHLKPTSGIYYAAYDVFDFTIDLQ